MPVDAAAVERAVREAFAARDRDRVLAQLASYGAQPNEPEPERVRLAIVRLANGDPARVEELLRVARVDYRDVLAWASGPPPSPEQAARDLAAAKEILAHWGKK